MMAARPALRCTSMGSTMAPRWRAADSEHGVRLQLRALGSEQAVEWLLDGRWIAQTHGAQLMQREFAEPGTHTLTALAADGAWTQVRFNVLR